MTNPLSEAKTSRKKRVAPAAKPIALFVVTASHSLPAINFEADTAAESRSDRHKQHTDRRAHFDRLSGRRQATSGRVEVKDDDVFGILVRCQKIFAGRVDAKTAGRLALSRNVLEVSEPAGALINGENHDAVVAAVRAVEKLSIRMNLHFRRAVIRFRCFAIRQGREGL